jgi:hypothetical protein
MKVSVRERRIQIDDAVFYVEPESYKTQTRAMQLAINAGISLSEKDLAEIAEDENAKKETEGDKEKAPAPVTDSVIVRKMALGGYSNLARISRWENITDEDGNVVPCNIDNIAFLFGQHPDLLGRFLAEVTRQEEGDEKNSETLHDGENDTTPGRAECAENPQGSEGAPQGA